MQSHQNLQWLTSSWQKNDLLRMITGPIHDLELLICVNLFHQFPTSPYNPAILGILQIFQTCLFHSPLNIPERSAYYLLVGSPIHSCLSLTCSVLLWNILLDSLAWAVGGEDGKRAFRRKVKIRYFLPSISATGSFSGSAAWRCQFSVSRLIYGSISTWQPQLPTSVRYSHLFSLSL